MLIRQGLLIALLTFPGAAGAREMHIPVRFDDELIRQYLISQAYTHASGTARAWDDGCNSLVLSDPQVHAEDGLVRVVSAGQARVGTLVGDRCLVLLDWAGFVEVFEEPVLSARKGIVEFQVVDSRIYGQDGESGGITGTLWDRVKQHVHPRLERVRLDLNPALAELKALLPLVFPNDEALAHELLDSVALSKVQTDNGQVTLIVQLEVPEAIATPPASAGAEPALTAEELQRWSQASRDWDALLTLVIKQAGANAALQEHRAVLLEILLDARRGILHILAMPPSGGADPVRKLFVETWSRLAPILRAESRSLPAESALRWLSFIVAADALQAIDALAPDLEFTLSADALRRLAHIAVPDLPEDPLHFSEDVDPELRRALGFGAPLPPPRPRPGVDLLSFFFIKPAQAADSYDALVEKLTGWIPTLDTLKEYLPLVDDLLNHVAEAALREGGRASAYYEMFKPLVLATAWQESCWRQFVEQGGKYVPINSGTGSVGIMQVNQHVWRGFYDVSGLHWDIGYNARAGAEILHHYLMDYAIVRDEHIKTGDIQNLARATYAMYNGGPQEMARYRSADTPASLRAIDEAFWDKYQTIMTKERNGLAVAECYGDT